MAHARQVREACLTRYREKKARRSYGKTIRYAMRKVNADRRPRIKGRFVKVSQPTGWILVLRVRVWVCGGGVA